MILFEDNAETATLHPENTLDVPEFTGDPQDIYLIKIIPFLESTRKLVSPSPTIPTAV